MGAKPTDVSGQKFNYLTALSRTGTDRHKHSIWECSCDCGNIVNATLQNLRSNKQKSCGCKTHQPIKLGQQFDNFTVISKQGTSRWLCRCICNKEKIVRSCILLGDRFKGCGCNRGKHLLNRTEDFTGMTIGYLKVVERSGQNDYGKTLWQCECICGSEIKITSASLKKGTKSCGCKRIKDRKQHSSWSGHEEISGTVWAFIKRNGSCRNLEFTITIEYVWDLFIGQNRKCALSGIDIRFPETNSQYSTATASLDRIDSSQGYIPGNVQWIHKKIQPMKMAMNEDEFIEFCFLIAKYKRKIDD